MREITSHKVSGLNEALKITVLDEPGSGGACHLYDIKLGNGEGYRLHFQQGPVGEEGPNGISIESLLAICADRLRGFQSGEFAGRENALALTKIQEAMQWLHTRTRDRVERGVEGTLQK